MHLMHADAQSVFVS